MGQFKLWEGENDHIAVLWTAERWGKIPQGRFAQEEQQFRRELWLKLYRLAQRGDTVGDQAYGH